MSMTRRAVSGRPYLMGGPIAAEAWPTKCVTAVPVGNARFAIPCQNPEESTSVVCVYFQQGRARQTLLATS